MDAGCHKEGAAAGADVVVFCILYFDLFVVVFDLFFSLMGWYGCRLS